MGGLLDDNPFEIEKKNKDVITLEEVEEKEDVPATSPQSGFIDTFIDDEIGQGSLKSRIKKLRSQLRPHKKSVIMWNEVGICPICGKNYSHPSAPRGKWRINVLFRWLTISDLPEKMCMSCWAKDIILQDLERSLIEQKVGSIRRGQKFEMSRSELLFWSQFYSIEKKQISDSSSLCEMCDDECIIEKTIRQFGGKCKRVK